MNTYRWRDNSWRYEYDAVGNLSKWLARIPSRAPEKFTLRLYSDFDQKNSVYTFSQPARLINLITGEGNGVGNPGAFKFYDGGVAPTQTGIVTYQYNGKALPTKASVSSFSANGTPTTTQVYKFTYQDCQ